MTTITLTLTDMANGGAALGRDELDRVVFVPYTIPGEKVRAEIVEERKRFVRARLLEVLEPSTDRVEPRCPHFGLCSGCHFQHIAYPAQLQYKAAVIRDQLSRIGGFEQLPVRPVLANPEPWAYAHEVTFNPASEGRLGFWSTDQGRVIPIDTCLIIQPQLLELYQDVDLVLPDLRKLTLRQGDDAALLVALEIDGVEPPAMETDFPLSVALVLPDGSAANLVGDNYLIQSVKTREFRISAGCFFYPSPPATSLLVDTVLNYAHLTGQEKILELYSGVGLLTAFLAPGANEVAAIEENPDAIADTVVNLNEIENVSLFEGPVEEIIPLINFQPDLMIIDPPAAGLPPTVIDDIARKSPVRLIYISSDVATLARDGQRLVTKGFRLQEVQPIDMYPQTFYALTVSEWIRD